VAPRWQEGCPLEETWIGRKGSEDFAGLVDYQDDYQPGARRFDMGERANFHLLPIAEAALGRILEWGVDEIAATLSAMTTAIAERAAEFGFAAAGTDERAGHYLGLRAEGGVPNGLLEALAGRGVFVSVRGDSIRVTPHLYNSDDDVERFFAALRAAM
jgi:selenocysteine lyase/cysteine desulfurase